jgi:hypothetical protein
MIYILINIKAKLNSSHLSSVSNTRPGSGSADAGKRRDEGTERA